jgi:prolyl-tRNA synthetase
VYTDEVIAKLGLTKDSLVEKKAIESGNIFHLGTKFSEPLGLYYTNEKEEKVPVWMGSYGIGPTRLMGTLVEVLADEKGIVWSTAVAPYRVHLVLLNQQDEEIRDWADGIYASLVKGGASVLYDDRDVTTGHKFADSDLIGIPERIIVSKKAKEEGRFEVVARATGETTYHTEEELYRTFCTTPVE